MSAIIDMSSEMYRFLTTLNFDIDGSLIAHGNLIDTSGTYISKYYTPSLKVASATKNFLSNLDNYCSIDPNLELEDGSLTYWLLHSGLQTKDYKMYNEIASVIADMYSYVYAINENNNFLRFVSAEDIDSTINDITYIIDYLSGYSDNAEVITQLNASIVSLGVLKNQLNLIKEGEPDGSV